MAKECQKCKTYKDCIGKQWYNYSEIRFCPYQVIWIIESCGVLFEGNWPDNPDGSSYVDPAIRMGFGDDAYYIKPEGILAEVEARLETTGDAGEALVDEIEDGRVTVIVKDGIIKIDGLSRPARRALMYAKGRRRKRESFPEWRADKKRRDGKP